MNTFFFRSRMAWGLGLGYSYGAIWIQIGPFTMGVEW